MPASGATIDRSAFRYSRELPPGAPGLTAIALDAAVLAHSRGLADLRIADAEGHQVPYVVEELDEPLVLELDEVMPMSGTGEKPGVSRYRLQLPYAGLPPAKLVLTTSARVFDRHVTLQMESPAVDARSQARRVTIASATWRHREPAEPAPVLVFNLPTLPGAVAELVIDEGDNRPLPLSRPQLLLPARRLRCFRAAEQPLTLLYGAPTVGAPRYDLALLAAQVIGARAHEVRLAAEVATDLPAAKAGHSQSKLFWGALIAAVVVLLVIIVRLLAKSEANEASRPE